MQSSELTAESLDSAVGNGRLEQYGLAEKLPLALLFGCLLGLSAPSFGISWLAWIGLIPLMVMIRGARGQVEASLTGLVFGLGYHMIGLSFYLGLNSLGWLGLNDLLGYQAVFLIWIVESLHEALLFAAFAWLVHCLPLRAGLIPSFRRPFFAYVTSLPVIWVFFQWVIGTSEMFLAIPVHQLAYSQHANTWLIQCAKFGGSGLVDFIIVLVNASLAQIVLAHTSITRSLSARLDKFSQKFGASLDAVAVLSTLLVAITWGMGELNRTEIACAIDRPQSAKIQSPDVPIGIIQGNVTVEEERLKTSTPAEIAKRITDLSTGHGVGILFCSEGLLTDSQFANGLLVDRLQGISLQERKEILSGSIENSGEHRVNSARLFSFRKSKNTVYVKQRLVPFGEFAPLGEIGQNISRRIEYGARSAPDKFVAGTAAHLIDCLWGRMGVAIGLEIIYPTLVSNEVRKGANILVNIANLGWFHSSSLNKELLAAGVFRAIENGRYVIIASNTGISAVIDPGGIVKSQSLAGKRGIILDTVQFLYKSTPFSRMWWL